MFFRFTTTENNRLGPVDGAKMDESPENYEEVLAKFKCILEGRLSKLSSVKDAKINTLKRKYCEDKQKINDDYLVKSQLY